MAEALKNKLVIIHIKMNHPHDRAKQCFLRLTVDKDWTLRRIFDIIREDKCKAFDSFCVCERDHNGMDEACVIWKERFRSFAKFAQICLHVPDGPHCLANAKLPSGQCEYYLDFGH